MLSVVARREDEESLSYMLVILNITGMVSSQRLNSCIVTDFLLHSYSYSLIPSFFISRDGMKQYVYIPLSKDVN